MPLILAPAVDVSDGQAARLTRGDMESRTDYGDPVAVAVALVAQGARWIHLVDMDKAFGRGDNEEPLRRVIASVACDVELSGGIGNAADVAAALDMGAARVNVSTAALAHMDAVGEIVGAFGDVVAVCLDVDGDELAARGRPGLRLGSVWEAMERLDALGCARYVVTDVSRDGAMAGPNLGLLTRIAARTDAAIVASGGLASLADISALKKLVPLGVEGAIIGKALYVGAFTLADALKIA